MTSIGGITLQAASKEPIPFEHVAIVLNAADNVAIAKRALPPRTVLTNAPLPSGAADLRIAGMIPPGHKIALRDIAEGEEIRKYGQIIGFATQNIAIGAHVHSQNLAVKEFDRDYAYCEEYTPVEYVPEAERRTFMGFRRKDGRVGTRNYVAVLASVNCSSSATRRVIEHFKQPGVLDAFPNVDGVVGFPTKGGCGAHYGSQDLYQLQRTMAGIVDHPNVAAYVILSLGCEVNQPQDMIDATSLSQGTNGHQPLVLTIQQDGGFLKTVDAGIAAVEKLLPIANGFEREPVPISELMVALQCGGSDSWSGVTANPALGLAADEIVRQGGTVVLGETTEVYGGEHLLTRRAVSREVGEALIERIHWWERYTALHGASIDNNPAPGNKLGGLTTIYEKSLGAIAKAGNTPLTHVAKYGERVTERGFVHMDTPGYDPVSVTGQVAGGCNVVVFSTGRGSAFGFKPAPSIKLATNSDLYAKQEPDMDINTGRVLDGIPLEQVGQEILDEIIAVASGKQSKSELAGVGEEEFNPWIIGAML